MLAHFAELGVGRFLLFQRFTGRRFGLRRKSAHQLLLECVRRGVHLGQDGGETLEREERFGSIAVLSVGPGFLDQRQPQAAFLIFREGACCERRQLFHQGDFGPFNAVIHRHGSIDGSP